MVPLHIRSVSRTVRSPEKPLRCSSTPVRERIAARSAIGSRPNILTVPAVAGVINLEPATGGLDAESDAEVRSEVWSLGVRHRGEALDGALAELKAGGLSTERAQLLQACVRQMKKKRPA